jgi:hypothetical protein
MRRPLPTQGEAIRRERQRSGEVKIWRGFTQREPRMSECRNKCTGMLALNLSRRDRNRADLSSDKER